MMRSVVASAALLVALPAWAQDNANEDNTPTIIVKGSTLAETGRQLDACLARHCAPVEDINASLAHAENQFLEGDYRSARQTLASAHNRNARFAAEHPVEVADLDRAYGRLTNLDGRPEEGRILQISSVEALKKGLGSSDSRVLVQRLQAGDDYLHRGRIDAAAEVYRKVEKQAREAGEIRVAGYAMFQSAALFSALSARDMVYRETALAKISRIERTTEPELAEFRTAARILRARLASASGDSQAMEAAVAKLGDRPFRAAVLVYDEPPFPDVPPATGAIRRNLASNPEWVDLRFRIDASGRVHDVEQLRTSSRITGTWTDDVLKSVAKRRYVPLALPAGSEGMPRVERFTLVFDAESTTGTTMLSRSTRGRLVSTDLTPDQPAS